jgi:hypothetical protein
MMTGHDTPDTPNTVVVDDPGQWLAMLPAALGFHPTTSLVVVCLESSPDGPGSGLGRILRVDLPEPAQHARFVASMVQAVQRGDADHAMVVVVDDKTDPRTRPHRELVLACRTALSEAGIPVTTQLWTSATTPGSPWASDTLPTATGVVADPDDITAVDGDTTDVVHASRDALAATLQPVDAAVLARRAALIDTLADHDPGLPAGRAGRLAVVKAAIGRAAEGLLPGTDAEIAVLAISLSDHAVRDTVLDLGDPAWVEPAEQVWTVLVRGTPLPYRCEPACLLAVSAYTRGHGALASLAIDASDPGHHLTGLLRQVREHGVHPQQLRRVAVTAAGEARRDIEQDGATRT